MEQEPLPVVAHRMAEIQTNADIAYYSAESIIAEMRAIGKRARVLSKQLKRTRKRLYRSTKRLCDLLDAL